MLKKVSIIIPVYNLEKYISKGLESCIKQTYQNIEVLVVDDGSSDRTSSIIEKYTNKDHRIRLFKKENGGVSSARNLALENVKGDYIIFLDGDDWLEETTVEYLVDIYNQYPGYLISSGMYNVIIEEDRFKKIYSHHLPEDRIISISQNDAFLSFGEKYRTLSACYKLFVSKIIDDNHLRFNEKLIYGEDGLFVFDYLHYCKGLIYQNIPLWNILTRPGSATSTDFNSSFLTAIDATELMIKRDNNTSFATAGAIKFCVSRIEGLITIALRSGIKRNKDNLDLLRKKLKEYGTIINSANGFSKYDYFKFQMYIRCPLSFLRLLLITAGNCKRYLKQIRSGIE